MGIPTVKIKCIKTSLISLATDKTFTKINDTVVKVNKIVIDAYNFIKLYTLYKYENSNILPKIDQAFILTVFKTVTFNSDNSGRKIVKNKDLLNELNDFYETNFKHLCTGKQDRKNLSHMMNYLSIDMLTNITNNIVLNFSKYIKNLLKLFYTHKDNMLTKKELNKLSNTATNELLYNKNKNVNYTKKIDDIINYSMKLDNIINDPKKADIMPFLFLDYIKTFYLPKQISPTLIDDIKNHPFNYLLFMIKINRKIEKFNDNLSIENKKDLKKLYQVLPLRTNIIPKYIPIDTTIVCDLLIDTGISEYYKGKTDKDIKNIWGLCFPNLFSKNNRHLIKNKTHKFDNLIYTDGVGVSIIQISNLIITKKDKFIAKKQKKNKKEFCYIDELNDDELKEINDNYNHLGVDPGKRKIVQMINDDGKKLSYSALQRRHECLHKANKKKIDAIKTEYIIRKESEISKTNSKSSFVKSFSEYLTVKYRVNSELFNFYQAELFRKLKWKSYIQTQKSEMAFVNLVRKTFESNGKKVCLMYGNWSQTKQQANYFPTPGVRYKRLLGRYFRILSIDEFRTSMLCYSCESETEKSISIKNPRPYKDNIVQVHSLLHCKNVNCNKFWDRDVNGSLNILKLAKHYIAHKTRKYNFNRKIKKDKLIPLIPAI